MGPGGIVTGDGPMPAAAARFVPCSGESWRSPWAMYAALRDHDPVHHVDTTRAGHDYWVLSRHEDVFAAVRDPATFSSAQGLTFAYDDRATAGLAATSPIVMMDPPEHTEFRRLVGSGFTPRHVAAIEPAVRRFVVDRVEQLRADGSADIVRLLFKPMPSFVVASYLGVPESDWGRFDGWTEGIVAANALGDPTVAGATVAELLAYFSELIERRRREPGDDTVSALVAAGADRVPIVQVLGFAFTMVAGGNDTTTGLLGSAAVLLTERPDQRALLLDDPGRIPAAVDELLRWSSPVQGLARTTTRDVELHGRTIPAGRKVLLLYGSANRDPRRFGPDADEIDIGRDAGPILSFGYGNHYCLGAAAARLQARIALEELLARCPGFAADGDAGTFAPGSFVRRHDSLPLVADAGA